MKSEKFEPGQLLPNHLLADYFIKPNYCSEKILQSLTSVIENGQFFFGPLSLALLESLLKKSPGRRPARVMDEAQLSLALDPQNKLILSYVKNRAS